MMKVEGIKPGEMWKRPPGEEIKDLVHTPKPKLAPVNRLSVPVEDISKEQKSQDTEISLRNSVQLEEKKVMLSPKSNAKKGTPEELGIDISFCSLTEEDTQDTIIPEELTEGKEYILKARKLTFDLLREINGTYDRLKPSKGIDIFTRDNGKDGQSVLGVGEIPFNVEKIAEVLADETQRKGFDDMLDEGVILNEFQHMTFVIYITFKKILILSPRDF